MYCQKRPAGKHAGREGGGEGGTSIYIFSIRGLRVAFFPSHISRSEREAFDKFSISGSDRTIRTHFVLLTRGEPWLQNGPNFFDARARACLFVCFCWFSWKSVGDSARRDRLPAARPTEIESRRSP